MSAVINVDVQLAPAADVIDLDIRLVLAVVIDLDILLVPAVVIDLDVHLAPAV